MLQHILEESLWNTCWGGTTTFNLLNCGVLAPFTPAGASTFWSLQRRPIMVLFPNSLWQVSPERVGMKLKIFGRTSTRTNPFFPIAIICINVSLTVIQHAGARAYQPSSMCTQNHQKLYRNFRRAKQIVYFPLFSRAENENISWLPALYMCFFFSVGSVFGTGSNMFKYCKSVSAPVTHGSRCHTSTALTKT